MTMTIVGYDPVTGQFGGAVATKNPAVGSRVLRGLGEVGMVGFSSNETQRRRGIALLQLGFPAPVALEALIKVSKGQGQYSLIDRSGLSAALLLALSGSLAWQPLRQELRLRRQHHGRPRGGAGAGRHL